jgi:DNA-binding MarR family transcriptional regulator
MAQRERVIRDDCQPSADILLALRQASRALTHLYDIVLSPTGLRATQVAILQAIQQHGEIAQWRLAGKFGISDGTFSRRLATLRAAGLIEQHVNHGQRRERLYQLTDSGIQKYKEVLPYWERAQHRLFEAIKNRDQNVFLRVVNELADGARLAESLKCVNSEPSKLRPVAANQPSPPCVAAPETPATNPEERTAKATSAA